ncbi:hypothetical protein J2T14_003743 [Paenibacillus harenae]|nr:hypothetical protein [Paenibacillus harenae]
MPIRNIIICAIIFLSILLIGAKLNEYVRDHDRLTYSKPSPFSVKTIDFSYIDVNDATLRYNPREYVKIVSLQTP